MSHAGHRERSEETDGNYWTQEQVQSSWDTYPTGIAPPGSSWLERDGGNRDPPCPGRKNAGLEAEFPERQAW